MESQRKVYRIVAWVAAVITLVVPILVLIGWQFNNEVLKRTFPGLTPMNPISAICFICIALALISWLSARGSNRTKKLVLLFAGITAALAFLKILDFLGVPTKIDQLLYAGRLLGPGDTVPNRMAPNTTANFLLVGLALIFAQLRYKITSWLSQLIIFVTLIISGLALVGYIYNFVNLYHIQTFIPMAVHVAILFFVVAIGFYSLQSETGVIVLVRKSYIKISLQIRISIFFILLLLVLVVVSVFSYSSIQSLKTTLATAAVLDEEIHAAKDLEKNLTNAETGQRGYLLTGDEKYLEPYNDALNNYQKSLTVLEKTAEGNDEVATVQEIAQVAQQKFNELNYTIQLRRDQGFDQALQVVKTNRGENYMTQIRADLEKLQANDNAEAEALNDLTTQKTERTDRTLAVSVFLGFVMVIIGMLITIGEIRRRTEVQKQLKLAKAKDDAILAGIGDAVFAIDANKRIILYNPTAAELSGYSIEEAMGRPYTDIFHFTKEGTQEIQDDFIKTALSGVKTAMKNHTVIHQKDGTIVPVADSAAPVFNDEGKVEGAVVVFRDVSEERAIEQAKSDFVSLTSHQLKTPIAQIKGFIANMLDGLTGELNPKQQEYLNDMLNVADSNSRLIDDLLNVSRIERRVIKFEPAVVDVVDIAKRATAPLQNVAAAKKVNLQESYPSGTVSVWADPNKTVEAIRNIIDNALKFTESGKSVSVTVRDGANPAVIIADQGSGIDVDVQKELFEKNRVWSGKVKASGAGLGLFLSKQFIELQGGKISYTTATGKGTTFTIEFKTHG